MTSIPLGAALRLLLQEKSEILLSELTLALKWSRPMLIFVVCQSDVIKTALQQRVTEKLEENGQSVVTIKTALSEIITNTWDLNCDESESSGHIYFLENGDQPQRRLSIRKESKVSGNFRHRVVLWVDKKELSDLVEFAPYFWYERSCVVDLVDSINADQILEEVLDYVQGNVNEEKFVFEDELFNYTDDKPERLKRGRLLLMLGVFEWRSKRLETAERYLKRAAYFTNSVQDVSLEVQCMNALALLHASCARFDEAILDYRKVISLAPADVSVWNSLGNILLKKGMSREASAVFLRVVSSNPIDAVAWNGIGSIHLREGLVEDAVYAFRKSIDATTDFPAPWCGLGQVYFEQGRYEEAVTAFNKAIALDPHYAEALALLAKTYASAGRFRDAKANYVNALQLDTHDSSLWNEFGLVEVALNEYLTAEDAFQKSIQLDAQNILAHENLAYLFYRQGRIKECIRYYKKSISLLSTDSKRSDQLNQVGEWLEAWESRNRSEVEERSAEDVAAMPEVSHAETVKIEVSPVFLNETGNASNQSMADLRPMNMGRTESGPTQDNQEMQISTGDGDMLKSFFAKVQKSKFQVVFDQKNRPQDAGDQNSFVEKPEVWNEKGNVFFSKNMFEKAALAYDRAIEIDGSFGRAYCNLALVFFMQGRHQNSITYYKRALDLLKSDGEKAMCWNGLGNVYRRIGDYENAMIAFNTATKLDRSTSGIREGADAVYGGQNLKKAEIRNKLGEMLVKSHEYEGAVIAFKSAISLAPSVDLYRQNLASLYMTLSKYHEAIDAYRESLELLRDDTARAAVWRSIGNAYRKAKDYDNAVYSYRKSISLSGENNDLLSRAQFSLLSNS